MASRSDRFNHRDFPPAYTIEPMDAPPMNPGSTTAQLKADIDSGRTGDKIEALDPGLSPLGTDDEAGGVSPTADQVDLARYQESVARWQGGSRNDGYVHRNSRKAFYAYVGFAALVLMVFTGAFSML